jgi:thioester reductase-like protein
MNVFITGVSGLLGGELLVNLSKRNDIKNIYCLIRGGSEQEAGRRIRNVFALHNDYFDPQKIKIVLGDLADPQLTESLMLHTEMKNVNIIIHSAANTSFSRFQDAAVTEANINGLNRIVQWAKTLRELQTFCYVSTATICGRELRNTVVHERQAPDMDATHLVKYTYTKMQGEVLLTREIPAEKLLIVRPSIIMGDSRDVEPRSPVILWALATINAMRLCMFEPDVSLDIISVDFAATAIEKVVFSGNRKYRVYHISSGSKYCTTPYKILTAIASDFEDLPPIKFIVKENLQLFKRWAKKLSNVSKELSMYEEYCRHFEEIFGQRENARIVFSGLEPYIEFIELGQVFDNSRLLEEFDIEHPIPAHEYVMNNIKYLKKINILEGAFNP